MTTTRYAIQSRIGGAPWERCEVEHEFDSLVAMLEWVDYHNANMLDKGRADRYRVVDLDTAEEITYRGEQ